MKPYRVVRGMGPGPTGIGRIQGIDPPAEGEFDTEMQAVRSAQLTSGERPGEVFGVWFREGEKAWMSTRAFRGGKLFTKEDP